ncbi:MAG TPA: carbonic anhydrase, partial [Acidimicrobiia bacterium]|nr:carbonic anhydrase [Acidimicrobiia bacterium]
LDTITAAGMVRHLASETDRTALLLADLDVSVRKHHSRHIAVAAHHDCVGNPESDECSESRWHEP